MSYAIFKNRRIAGIYERPILDSPIQNVTEIEWVDDLTKCFNTFSFTTTEELECGQIIEIVELNDNKTVLRGPILEITKEKQGLLKYSGYDCGVYLDKNSAIIQYTGQDVTNAIKRLCDELRIPVSDKLPNIDAKVKKIFYKKIASEIVKDLLNIAEMKNPMYSNLYVDCSLGYLDIKKYTENNNLKAHLSNIYSANSFNLITTYNVETSFKDLKNHILIPKKDVNKMEELDFISDEESISQFGFLQDILEVDNDSKQDYKEVAYNKLQELKKPTQTIKLTFLGDYNTRKGVITSIDSKELKLKGKYLIHKSTHTINGSKELIEGHLSYFGPLDTCF